MLRRDPGAIQSLMLRELRALCIPLGPEGDRGVQRFGVSSLGRS